MIRKLLKRKRAEVGGVRHGSIECREMVLGRCACLAFTWSWMAKVFHGLSCMYFTSDMDTEMNTSRKSRC